jgi:cytochrome c peroxidase
MSRQDAAREARALGALGEKLFADPVLSASGRLSCSSCHDPKAAFGPPNGQPVQPGGPDLAALGRRAVPSLMYLQSVPPFAEHRFDAEAPIETGGDSGPSGGLTWDGRVDRGRSQARIPLLSPDEMANASPEDVGARLAHSREASDIRALDGAHAFDRPAEVFELVLRALEAYEQDPVFYPYTSKYDAFLDDSATLAPDEARGLAAFEDPQRGNCARCHVSRRGSQGTPPQFTDYGLVAIAVPRNQALPANRPGAYDLGLCGPIRTDFLERADYCGRFMTPTLRNVGTRGVFFHNGAITSLRTAVEFYATRDSSPERWYSRDDSGRLLVFDDLPPDRRSAIDRERPFGQRPGDPPALSPADIGDIVAFLGTLTDGYRARR